MRITNWHLWQSYNKVKSKEIEFSSVQTNTADQLFIELKEVDTEKRIELKFNKKEARQLAAILKNYWKNIGETNNV